MGSKFQAWYFLDKQNVNLKSIIFKLSVFKMLQTTTVLTKFSI